MSAYAYIATTVVLTQFGQLVVKWRVDKAGALPPTGRAKLRFLLAYLRDPWIISVFATALLAALAWMAALTQLELSRAYPFLATTFVFVLLLSWPLFGETLTRYKVLGVALIAAGLTVGAQG
jgi:drug/metabolite transporter (DMT)-like permease